MNLNRILLIDDDPTMLRLLQTLLRIEGFNPIPWTGGIDVIDETIRTNPEVILMDVNLRSTNGIDVLRQMRASEELAFVPVIMTSGMDCRLECLEAGANDFLIKPYMPDILIRSIRSHMAEEV